MNRNKIISSLLLFIICTFLNASEEGAPLSFEELAIAGARVAAEDLEEEEEIKAFPGQLFIDDKEVEAARYQEKKQNKKWYHKFCGWIRKKTTRRRSNPQAYEHFENPDLTIEMAQVLQKKSKDEESPAALRKESKSQDVKDPLKRRSGKVFSLSDFPLDDIQEEDKEKGYLQAWNRKYSGDDPFNGYANVFPQEAKSVSEHSYYARGEYLDVAPAEEDPLSDHYSETEDEKDLDRVKKECDPSADDSDSNNDSGKLPDRDIKSYDSE